MKTTYLMMIKSVLIIIQRQRTVWFWRRLTRQTRLLVTPFRAVTFFDLLMSKYGPLVGILFPLKLSRVLSSEPGILMGWTKTLIPVSSINPWVIEAKFLPPVPGGRYGGTFFSKISAVASSNKADVLGMSRFSCCCRRCSLSSNGQPKKVIKSLWFESFLN